MKSLWLKLTSQKISRRTPTTHKLKIEHLEDRITPVNPNWTLGPALPTAVGGAVLTSVSASNQLVLLGGQTNTGSTTTIETLDPSLATGWTAAGNIDQGRAFPGYGFSQNVVGLPSTGGDPRYLGIDFLIGGSNQGASTNTTLNDPTNSTNSVNGPSMTTARSRFASASDPASGEIFAIGGLDSSGKALASGEVYIGSLDQWQAIAPLPQAISGGAGFADNAGHIFVFGGRNAAGQPLSTVYRYTIATNLWDRVADLPYAAGDMAVIHGQDGQAYLFGGLGASGAIANVETYSPAGNSWSADSPLAVPVYGAAATLGFNNDFWVVGGFNSAGQPSTVVEHSQSLPLDVATQLEIVQGPSYNLQPYQPFNVIVASADAAGNVVDASPNLVIMTTAGVYTYSSQTGGGGGESVFSVQASTFGSGVLQFNESNLTGVNVQYNVLPATTQQAPVINFPSGSFIYDSQQHALVATAYAADGVTPINGVFSYSYYSAGSTNLPSYYTNTGTPPTFGSYTVVASFTSLDPNYADAFANATLVIAPPIPTVVVTGGDFANDGTAHSASAVASAFGTTIAANFVYTYTDSSGNSSTTAPSAPGRYTVNAAFTDPSGFYANTTGTGILTIGAGVAVPTVQVITGLYPYSGGSYSLSATAFAMDGITPVVGNFHYTYNGSAAYPSLPGIYTVTAAFTSGDPNYANSVGTGVLVIECGTPTINIHGGTIAYNGLAHTATASAVGVDGVTPVAGTFSFLYDGSSAPPSAPGVYTVEAIFTSADLSYISTTAYGTLTIASAQPVAPTLIAWGGPFTYNGQSHSANAIALGLDNNTVVAGSFTFTYNGSATLPVNAGAYTVTATFTPADPNYASASTTSTITINTPTPNTPNTGGAIAWDGSAKSAAATAIGIDGSTSVPGVFSFTYNGSSTPPSLPGTYAVVATFTSADPNYTGGTASTTLTISDPTIVTGVTANGTSASTIQFSWNAAKEVDGGTPTYSIIEKVWVKGTHSPKGSGGTPGHYIYPVVASGITTPNATIGASGSNTYYVVSVYKGVTSAFSAPVTGATWVAAGYMEAITLGGALVGSLNVEVGQTAQIRLFTYYGSPAPTFSILNGPSTMSVDPITGIVTYTPGLNEVGNLTVTFQAANVAGSTTLSFSFVVKPMPTIVFTTTQVNYNGTAQPTSATAYGVDGVTPVVGTFSFEYEVAGEPFTLSTSPYAYAGTYTVFATFTSGDPNYGNATATGTLIISRVTPTLTLNTGPFVATGAQQFVTATATGINGETVAGIEAITYNGSPIAPSAPGTYAVQVLFTSSDQDYTDATASATLVIVPGPATPTVTVTGGTFVVNGTQRFASAVAYGTDGVTPVAGTFSFSYNGSPTAPTLPGEYIVVVTFTSSDPNYSNSSGAAILNIVATATAATITVPSISTTYTGTAQTDPAFALGVDGVSLVAGTFNYTYNGSTTPPTSAGVYTVNAVFISADPSYVDSSGVGTLTILPAVPALVINGGIVNGGNFIYTGQPVSATAQAVGVDGITPVPGTFTYTYNGSSTAPTAAGTYAVTVTFTSGDPNYADNSTTSILVIGQATPSITVTGGPFTYNGAAQSVNVLVVGIDNVTPVAGTMFVTYNGSSTPPTDVGIYTVNVAFLSSDPNYADSATSATLQIVPASPTIGFAGGPLAYNGSAQTANAAAIGVDGVTQVAGTFSYTYNGSSTAPTNPGVYNVVANFTSSDPDYADATGNGVLTIVAGTPATVTVPTISTYYTGAAQTDPASAVGSDGITPVAGSFTYTYNGSPTPPTIPGVYTVSATFTSADPNYVDSNGTGTLTILPATPTVTVGAAGFTYTGQSFSSTANAVGVDGVTAVSGSITYTYNGSTTPPTAAGTYAVIANFTSSDPDYANSSTSGTLTINAAVPTVTVSGGVFTFNGSAQSATATVTGVGGTSVSGTWSFTYNGSATAPTAAGTYAVLTSFTSSDPNYSNASGTGTLTINAAVPTVTVSGGVFTFNGSAQSASATASGVGGTSVSGTWSFTYNGSATAPTAAGTYVVLASFTSSDPNYSNASGTGTLTINKAVPVFSSLSSLTITTGTASTAISGNLAAGSVFPTGDSVSISINGVTQTATVDSSGNFSSSFATSSLKAGKYTITFAFVGDAANFAAAATGTGVLTVAAAVKPATTLNPTSQTVNAGSVVTMTAAASGTPAPTVQWQISTNGGKTFANISGATSLTYTFTATAALNLAQYRAVFTNSAGTATTRAATLTVHTPPTVTLSPLSQSVKSGVTVTFTASATASPAATVQWQVSTDGGKTFINISGATRTTLSIKTTSAMNQNQYRAVFTNSVGAVISQVAVLTVV